MWEAGRKMTDKMTEMGQAMIGSQGSGLLVRRAAEQGGQSGPQPRGPPGQSGLPGPNN